MSAAERNSADWIPDIQRWVDLDMYLRHAHLNVPPECFENARSHKLQISYDLYKCMLIEGGVSVDDNLRRLLGAHTVTLIPNKFPYDRLLKPLNNVLQPTFRITHYLLLYHDEYIHNHASGYISGVEIPGLQDILILRNGKSCMSAPGVEHSQVFALVRIA